MRFFTLFIIIFSITGTVWSMWLSNELKNEELKLKTIKIIDLDHNDLELLYSKNLLDNDLIKPLYLG